MSETMTPELEISAARMDVECTTHRLIASMNWIKDVTRTPRYGHIEFAMVKLRDRVEHGDSTAVRAMRAYEEAATDYEGARVALAELITPTFDMEQAVVLTGDEARALRAEMAGYAAANAR